MRELVASVESLNLQAGGVLIVRTHRVFMGPAELSSLTNIMRHVVPPDVTPIILHTDIELTRLSDADLHRIGLMRLAS